MKMNQKAEIIDTFLDFQTFWDEAPRSDLDELLDRYEKDYLKKWPELFRLQREGYEGSPLTWKEAAEDRILPFLEERYPLMVKARKNLLKHIPTIYEKSVEKLDIDFSISFVLHVGIGAAGWAHFYEGERAVLHGLEMIAEENWVDESSIRGLVAHEIGHHYHLDLREKNDVKRGDGPFWDIYEEGIAQRCEHIILEEDNWHMKNIADDWLEYCENNLGDLARKYLEWVEEGKNTNKFFGNWYDIDGYSMIGYHLGHEVIKNLENSYGLDEISIFPLEKIDEEVRRVLKDFKNI